jgi:hypothetical protein
MVDPVISGIRRGDKRVGEITVPCVAEVVVLAALSCLYRVGSDLTPLRPSFSGRKSICLDGENHPIGDGAIVLEEGPLDSKNASMSHQLHLLERGVGKPRPLGPDSTLDPVQLKNRKELLREHLKEQVVRHNRGYYGVVPAAHPKSTPSQGHESFSAFEHFCADLGGYFQLVEFGDSGKMTRLEIQLNSLIQKHFFADPE